MLMMWGGCTSVHGHMTKAASNYLRKQATQKSTRCAHASAMHKLLSRSPNCKRNRRATTRRGRQRPKTSHLGHNQPQRGLGRSLPTHAGTHAFPPSLARKPSEVKGRRPSGRTHATADARRPPGRQRAHPRATNPLRASAQRAPGHAHARAAPQRHYGGRWPNGGRALSVTGASAAR